MTPENVTPKTSAAVPPTAKLSSGLPRDIVPIGPSSGPEAPYPLKIEGPVVKGFGRGSKELNTPTANIPVEGLSVGGREDVESGVYFGWAGLDLGKEGNEELAKSTKGNVFPMVMSIGWNPFYKNTVRSVEVHIMHTFPSDFYGTHMKLLVLGYIRPQLDYVSKEALISDIRTDIEIARVSLERKGWGVEDLGGEGKWVGEF